MNTKEPQNEGGADVNIETETPSSNEINELENVNPVEEDHTKQLEEEVSSLKDLYLRKQAEFENFRKRVGKEKEDLAVFANRQLMEEFIGLMDNFERALESSEQAKDFNQFFSGMSVIYESFLSNMSNKFGLEAFGTVGDLFDPEKHEAISMEADEKVEEPVIKEVFQKGYSLQGRVIRSAKVKVVQS